MKHSALMFAVAATVFAQDTPIDTAHSTITIHVLKAGLLSAAGHDHWVDAPISSGTIRESPPSVEFTVETARMKVKPDPKLDAKTQAQIQKDMEEMALDTARFPRITFRSTRVEKASEGKWMVTGDLAMHGVTKPVTVTVTQSGGAYVAHSLLKQSDFGMKPISVGGGMIKVKNEIDLDFHIVPGK